MGEAAMAANDTFDVSVPPHLAEAFDKGLIDQEDLLIQSANYYSDKLSEVEAELTFERNKNESLLNEIKANAGQLFTAKQQASGKAELEAKLKDANNKLLSLSQSAVRIETLTDLSQNLTAQVGELQHQIEKLTPQAKEALRLAPLVESLQEKLFNKDNKIAQLESELRVATNKLKGAAQLESDLRNNLSAVTKQIDSLKESRDKAYEKRDELQTSYDELMQAREADFKAMDETQKSVLELVDSIRLCDNNIKVTSRENQVLSLLVHSLRSNASLCTESGHKLIPYLLDEQQVRQKGGRILNTAIKDVPVFLWVNPNGFACTISLHHDTSSENPEDVTVLMPSLTQAGDGRTEEEAALLRQVTQDICPMDEHYQLIADHMIDVSAKELKEAFLKAFAQANVMTEKHGQLEQMSGRVELSQWKNKLDGTLSGIKKSKDNHKKFKKHQRRKKR